MDPFTLTSIGGLLAGLVLAAKSVRRGLSAGVPLIVSLAAALALVSGVTTIVSISLHILAVAGGAARRYFAAPNEFVYDFRLYALLLMGAVIWVTAFKLIAAALRLSRGDMLAHSVALQCAAVLFLVIAPLLPIQSGFAIGLGSFALLAVLGLASARARAKLEMRPP